MTEKFVKEVLEKFDKFMVENEWGILIASSPTIRIYRALNKLFLWWIIYTSDNTWQIRYNNIENITRIPRTAEFKATGNPDKDYTSVLENILKIVF